MSDQTPPGAEIAEALAEAWERGRAAERTHAAQVRAYTNWSSISPGPPTDPQNPYRTRPSQKAEPPPYTCRHGKTRDEHWCGEIAYHDMVNRPE